MTRTLTLALAALLAGTTAVAAQTTTPMDPATTSGDTTQSTTSPMNDTTSPTDPAAPGANAPMSQPQPGDPAMTPTPSDPGIPTPADPMTPPSGDMTPNPTPGVPMPGNAATDRAMRGPPTDTAGAQFDPMSGDPASASSGGVMPAGGMDAVGAAQGFATYDAGGKGYLTPLEFARMMAATTGQSTGTADAQRTGRGAGNATVSLLNRYATEFLRADVNRDNRVTTDELAGASTLAQR